MTVDIALFAQQLVAVIDEGRRTGTHKLLTLLALIDAATEASAAVTDELTLPVEDVATSVIRIVWRQVAPFEGGVGLDGRLSQLQGGGTNALVDAVATFRAHAATRGIRDADVALARLPHERAAAIRSLSRVLVENPLPRLQRGATGDTDFLYRSWPAMQSVRRVRELQQTERVVVRFLPGAAGALVRLGALVRPLVESAIIDDVARWNGIDLVVEDALRARLFGGERTGWPAGLVDALHDLQGGRCFYTGAVLRRSATQVDHVLPWSRTNLDAVPNLVLATLSANASKSDLLPAFEHVTRWVASIDDRAAIAKTLDLEPMVERTLAVGSTLYRHLPDGSPLWVGRSEGGRTVAKFDAQERTNIERSLAPATWSVAAEPGEGYD